ncbi:MULTISPECIES: PP2C family protein-serine/threonine phosphatase [unclassified Nonomuraea]|uniref:PP2C family protein-serine/threonine phosphatase n=1 Tax=unclassified Nonomuraea TaxID=2593643 RepID=UPI0035C0118F
MEAVMGLEIHDYLSVLSEASLAMTSSLDGDTALRRLSRILVPRLADWCAVDLVEGETVRRVSVAMSGPETRFAHLHSKTGPLPLELEDLLLPILRTSGALLLTAPGTTPADVELGEARTRLRRVLAADSAIVAPLRVRGNALGALTLARFEPGSPLTDADVPIVEDLAHRAALAVDNTRLYGLQHEMATRLQHSLLPRLPDISPLRLAAGYLPARESSQVGGDWYDAFRLSDGTPALVIGDVEGHDITAATQMSEVRNMLRALAFDGREKPSQVVSHLDRVLGGVGGNLLTTMVLAHLEGPATGPWQLRWANAGHPAPLLITRDGGTRFLEEGRSALLGLDPTFSRADAVEALPPRSTVLFYTDGLIERRTEPLDRGMTRLRRQAGTLAGADVQTICDELITLADKANEDDIALLAVQLPDERPTA